MELEDLLAWIKERMDEGEYDTVETFLNDMDKRARDGEEYRASSEAKMGELNKSIEELTAGNKDLKARNYDLLMQLPGDEDEEDPVEDVVDEDGELYHIENLFVDPDEEKEE